MMTRGSLLLVTFSATATALLACCALLLLFFFGAGYGVNSELLPTYNADPVDNRPSGRFRFSMMCFAYKTEFWLPYEHTVAVLGGTSPSDIYSSELHFFHPKTGRWEEQTANSETFNGRHSFVGVPVAPPGGNDVELQVFGGFQLDPNIGTAVVDNALIKSMAAPLPWIQETESWEEPFLVGFEEPGARARHSAFYLGSAMYVFGGITGDGGIKGDLWKFESLTSSYQWVSIYQPSELSESELYNYDFSTDDYGGGGFTGYSGGAFSFGGGSFPSGASSGGSFPGSSFLGRFAEVEEQQKQKRLQKTFELQHQQQDEEDKEYHDAEDHHIHDIQSMYEKQHYQRQQEKMLLQEKKQQQKMKKLNNQDDDNENDNELTAANYPSASSVQQKQNQNNRNAEGESFYCGSGTGSCGIALGSGSVSDTLLFRYGSCCAAASSTEAVCFGGTGNTGDYRTVLYHKEGTSLWQQLNISNANDGPKPVRDAACAYSWTTSMFIVYGGYDSRTGAPTTDRKLYFLNVTSGKWNSTGNQDVSPIFGHAMCTSSYNNKTYMFGGKSSLKINASLFVVENLFKNSTRSQDALNTVSFELATAALDTLPLQRAYHIAAPVGTSFFVGFGKTGSSLYSDFWEYDALGGTWSKKTSTGRASARWGSSVAVLGPSLFIFGGRIALTGTKATNELLVYDTIQHKFSTVVPSDEDAAVPAARAFHVAFESSSKIIMGLGQDTSGHFLDDWWMFSPISQSWTELTVQGDAISARVGSSTLQSYNETFSLLGLGYDGTVGLRDWYFVRVEGTKLLSKKIPVYQNHLENRQVMRSFASVAGRGRHVLVCGGMVSDTLASPPDGRCYQLDVLLNNESIKLGLTGNETTPDELGLVGAPAVYLKDSIFVFGGQVITDPGLSDTYFKRLLRIRPSSTCNVTTNNPDDTSCSLCGFGASGINCGFTTPGYYTTIAGNTVACPTGSHSPIRGGSSSAVCVPCGFGTYSNTSGQSTCHACNTTTDFCPVGSSSIGSLNSQVALALSASIPQGGVLEEDNPAAYSSPGLPWFPVGIVAGASIALALFVMLVLFLNKKNLESKIHYYLPDEIEDKLTKIFVTHAKDGREMSLAQLIQVVNALNFSVSAAILQKNFEDQTEDTGLLYITLDDFKTVFIDLIKMGALPPFAGSPAEKEGRIISATSCAGACSGFQLAQIDNFNSDHIPAKLGVPRRVIQTWYGGLFTILWIVTFVIMVLAILVNFLYANVSETKAIVPYPVIQASFGDKLGDPRSNLLVEVAVSGPIRESVRWAASDTALEKTRKACIDSDTQTCTNQTKVVASGVTIPFSHNERLDCKFDETTRECHVQWFCDNCTVIAAADLLFTFSSEHSATRIASRVVASTGIRPPEQEWTGELQIASGQVAFSSITEAIVPTKNTELFSGFPATHFSFGLSPTFFESVELEHIIFPSKENVLESGYHLRPDANPVPGNQISPQLFGTYFDCPVKVSFKTDAEMMIVRRVFIQTIVDLVSSLLGAISGIAGVFLTFTNLVDESQGSKLRIEDVDEEAKEFAKKRREERKKRGEEVEEDEDGQEVDDFTRTMVLPGEEDFSLEPDQAQLQSASEEESKRVLKMVSYGLPVDLALCYQNVIRTSAIPHPAGPFKLDELQQFTEQMPPSEMSNVQEIVLDHAPASPTSIEAGGEGGGDGKSDPNMNASFTGAGSGKAIVAAIAAQKYLADSVKDKNEGEGESTSTVKKTQRDVVDPNKPDDQV